MPAIQIKWSNLLRISELEFIPEAPKLLRFNDEIQQVLSWLTGATGQDRRLLRCDNNGALLIANAWSLLTEVEVAELFPTDGTPYTHTATVGNKGVLVSTSSQLVLITFARVQGGAEESVYVSPNWLYWFPHSVYSVKATVVPASGGTESAIGVTFFS